MRRKGNLKKKVPREAQQCLHQRHSHWKRRRRASISAGGNVPGKEDYGLLLSREIRLSPSWRSLFLVGGRESDHGREEGPKGLTRLRGPDYYASVLRNTPLRKERSST